jgi:hypothetical protein
MKNRSRKTILVFFALGLISCTLCVQRAQAAYLNAALNFAGGLEMNSGSVNTASQVTGWLDEGLNPPAVTGASGNFASFVAIGDSVIFNPSPWNFLAGGPVPLFWTVDGFTFNLIASSVDFNQDGFLLISGSGTVTGNGYTNRPASWHFSVQDEPSNGVFSFSGGIEVPDGGTTLALLGLALAGLEGIRRKLRSAKS